MLSTTHEKKSTGSRLERTHKERVRRISAFIRRAEAGLRRKFPVLAHQDALGAGVFCLAAGWILTGAILFGTGRISAWLLVPLSAFCVSLLHELEHDLIHGLYFNSRKRVQNLLMAGVWFFRPNFPSPWYRRKIHLLHHKESGQAGDIEERYLGNGMEYGWRRLLCMLDNHFSPLLRKSELRRIPGYLRRMARPSELRMFLVFDGILVLFGISLAIRLIASQAGWPLNGGMQAVLRAVDFLMIVYILPCVITRAAVGIVSSSMHYHGDVNGLLEQTQVLTPWYLAPFQLFCFNFGSTHAIHHIVVNQPFYMRQLVAPAAHAVMRRYGVRFNDTETFRRANRYHAAA